MAAISLVAIPARDFGLDGVALGLADDELDER
jgi:hypothetical protein